MSNSQNMIPYWNRKAETFGVIISKFEAKDDFVGVGDALDSVLMRNYSTQLVFEVQDTKKGSDQGLIDLYMSNKKL